VTPSTTMKSLPRPCILENSINIARSCLTVNHALTWRNAEKSIHHGSRCSPRQIRQLLPLSDEVRLVTVHQHLGRTGRVL
jgi:hypothetical protein